MASPQLKRIVVLPGDHVGPEVTEEAVRVLKAVLGLRQHAHGIQVEFTTALFGGAAIDKHDVALTDETRALIDDPKTCAVLVGAVGGPEWPPSCAIRPEQGILDLRKHLNAFVNVRPCVFPSQSLIESSPLKADIVTGVHFVVLRELCGGIYFGDKLEAEDPPVSDSKASDLLVYSVREIERIGRIAGVMARDLFGQLGIGNRPKVTSIDKANVLASSRLWKRVLSSLFQREFPDVELQHLYVDAAAMHMVKNPRILNGIVVTGNLFGDILSDEASALVGSLGLLPSASLSGYPETASVGLYEPIHGSAPDISGQSIANPIGAVLSAAMLLRYSLNMSFEAKVIEDAVRRVLDANQHGGYAMRTRDLGGNASTRQIGDKICEIVREVLGEVSSKEYFTTTCVPRPLQSSNQRNLTEHMRRRPMTLCEKILAHHAVGLSTPGHVAPNDMICVKVDWTLASELTWKGMEKTYREIGSPKIWRNDRFWLAIDHTVDPSINHLDKPQTLIGSSKKFADSVGLTDFYGPNQTILHTEFYRQRAQPGMIIIGADSHSCSAGGIGALAVGLGAADVLMPLITGDTWFRVPETCNIRFVGKPPFGIGGKDVILWVLGELKRNTVAFERAVEFTGPGCRYLSCDARFAISNMTTEFGGIAGVFEADEIAAAYIAKRDRDQDKCEALYFRADKDAQYAQSYTIDLTQIESVVALYPSPDNVVPITEIEGMALDGVFIGACTTTEEDLILAALVLEQGLKLGWAPGLAAGKRKVTPGSVQILAKLRRLGLIDIYEQAGFEIGAPGCSYCLGIAADKAGEGEVWLSSQNRNFKNRMGKGSIGNLSSAAAVAASSFDMRVKSPRSLLALVDQERYKSMCLLQDTTAEETAHVDVSEPSPNLSDIDSLIGFAPPPPISAGVSGRVQRFGHHVDTDAIIPAEFMPGDSDQDLGSHCFQYVRPEFREKVQRGYSIVVAGTGFGSGSSREEAPRALKGCGVVAVVAKSFAFIYSRNQPNMALLGIVPHNFDAFYDLAQEGVSLHVDVLSRTLTVQPPAGSPVEFKFELSQMEERLVSGGGVTSMYSKYGKALFRAAMMHACDADNTLPVDFHPGNKPVAVRKGGLVGTTDFQDKVVKMGVAGKPVHAGKSSACQNDIAQW